MKPTGRGQRLPPAADDSVKHASVPFCPSLLHIFSLGLSDRVSVSSRASRSRIMSFTCQRFWAPAYSSTPTAIVSHRDAVKNLPQGAAHVRVLARPIFFRWPFALLGVYMDLGFFVRRETESFQS